MLLLLWSVRDLAIGNGSLNNGAYFSYKYGSIYHLLVDGFRFLKDDRLDDLLMDYGLYLLHDYSLDGLFYDSGFLFYGMDGRHRLRGGLDVPSRVVRNKGLLRGSLNLGGFVLGGERPLMELSGLDLPLVERLEDLMDLGLFSLSMDYRLDDISLHRLNSLLNNGGFLNPVWIDGGKDMDGK